ncbi:hypothetical protein PAXRUDRAFT_133987 [Paxillus rubicundulus Ve08.2h10]|uniref:F-box domain-containing protein n=1 Tax=Paxillus rubicundulus Ve08.2h10 TaxID=930991 RepID=A0A0D0E347_9AGAM|nr:hypothetical protein PAXRUDRAFT_133987 [Paxillus rubicundulus Ve08.2h10]
MALVTAQAFSPEICNRIVRWTRRGDLTTLCLTCKPLQREAEAKLYEVIMSGNIQITSRACQSIVSQPRLGSYVRSFGFFQDGRRSQREISEQFWSTLQLALSKMRSLECLFIQDPSFANSWILGDVVHMPFQLLEAKLLFYWDAHLVKFLESQNKLRNLHTIDGPANNASLQLEAGSLSELRVFDGPLAAAEPIVFVATTLTHLQVALEKNSEADVLALIPKLSHVAASLRALSILHLPEALAMEVFRSITTTCPQLRHIGTIPLPLPSKNSNRFHRALMGVNQLRILEVDVTSWTPQPTGILQRALAAEIRIYCPSIEYICFGAGATRTLWMVDGNDWSCHSETGQHSQFDALWKAG